MLISERIYQIMKEKRITQLEFARRTGISQSTVSDWRRKGTNPSSDKIMIICDVLEVSPYELLAGTENKKLKEYNQPKNHDLLDCVIIDKESKEYQLIEMYRKLDAEEQERVETYMKSLGKK